MCISLNYSHGSLDELWKAYNSSSRYCVHFRDGLTEGQFLQLARDFRLLTGTVIDNEQRSSYGFALKSQLISIRQVTMSVLLDIFHQNSVESPQEAFLSEAAAWFSAFAYVDSGYDQTSPQYVSMLMELLADRYLPKIRLGVNRLWEIFEKLHVSPSSNFFYRLRALENERGLPNKICWDELKGYLREYLLELAQEEVSGAESRGEKLSSRNLFGLARTTASSM